jgi:hypothetical protein
MVALAALLRLLLLLLQLTLLLRLQEEIWSVKVTSPPPIFFKNILLLVQNSICARLTNSMRAVLLLLFAGDQDHWRHHLHQPIPGDGAGAAAEAAGGAEAGGGCVTLQWNIVQHITA